MSDQGDETEHTSGRNSPPLYFVVRVFVVAIAAGVPGKWKMVGVGNGGLDLAVVVVIFVVAVGRQLLVDCKSTLP